MSNTENNKSSWLVILLKAVSYIATALAGYFSGGALS